MSSLEKMSDGHEGLMPQVFIDKATEYIRRTEGEDAARGFENITKSTSRLKKETFISSWNMQECESYPLWKIYTKESDAIAIKSTISRLLNSFNEENELHQYVGTVKYHDGIKYSFRGNMFDPVMYKWNYYQFENELRIVTPFRAKNFDALKTHPNGVTPIVNTGELIDKIYLSPNASQEHFEKVNQLLKEHNLKKDIYFSGINEKWNNSKI